MASLSDFSQVTYDRQADNELWRFNTTSRSYAEAASALSTQKATRLQNARQMSQNALEIYPTPEGIQKIGHQQQRYEMLGSNPTKATHQLPAASVAQQLESSASVLNKTASLGVIARQTKLLIWTGAIMSSFTNRVLLRFNALTSEKLKGLHELRFRLANEEEVFNIRNNRRPSDRITFTDWEVERLNSRPELFPDYLTLLNTLEELNFKARHWTRLCMMKAIRNDYAHQTLPTSEWEECVMLFVEEFGFEQEDCDALLSCVVAVQ